MKVEELIQRILSGYSKGVQSDDSRLTHRHVYSIMLTARAKLLTQRAKKKQKISDWGYTSLPCVEFEVAPSHECPCLPAVGCSILKSKYPLPKPLTNYGGDLVRSVTSIAAPNEDMVVYNHTTWKEKKYSAGRKYTSMVPEYWIRNGYVYTSYRTGPKVVNVDYLPEDPYEALQFPSFCGTTLDACFSPLDMDFPLDMDLVEAFVKIAVEELTILFLPSQQDIKNNSVDERAGI